MVWGMVIHPVMKIHPHHGYLNPYQNGLMMTVPQYGYVYTCVYIYYIWLLVLSSHDPTFHHGIMGSGKVGRVGPIPEEMVITCHDFAHEISSYFIYPTL